MMMKANPLNRSRAILTWLALLLCLAFVASACSGTGDLRLRKAKPGEIIKEYHKHIIEWQERSRKEGWSEKLLDDVVAGCIGLSKYENEEMAGLDEWKTYREMVRAGMVGDCEDIAALIHGTLKKLQYPLGHRILVVNVLTMPIDHAVMLIESPETRKWTVWDTTPFFLNDFAFGMWVPLFAFDENDIWVYDEGETRLFIRTR